MARQMKDSSVDWIGKIPEEWEVCKLKKLISFINGYPFDSSVMGDEGNCSVVRIGDLQNNAVAYDTALKVEYHDELSNYLIRNDDILIAMSGATVGKFAIVNNITKSACVNQRVGIIRSNISGYLKYILASSGFSSYITLLSEGTAQPNISTTNINNFSICIPPPAETQIIIAYLDTKCAEIDKVVEQTRATIEEYKKLKQAIITEAVTKGLDSSVPMKDSGVEYLGCIPRGWSIISIGQAFVYVGGFAFKSELFTITESNYQVLRIGNVKNDNLILENKQIYIDESCAETAKVAEVRTDDILFTMTGTKGKRDYFYTVRIEDGHIAEKRLFINQRVGLFRKKNKKIKMAFANYLLKETRILDYIFLSETGTANQGNLGIETIARTKLYLPPLEEQEEICLYLDTKCAEIDRIIEKKEQLIEELGSYKKSLIYEYVTGKKEVTA